MEEALRRAAAAFRPHCLHCAGERIVRNGTADGLHRLRDVATCYLENYLGWFRALDRTPRGAGTVRH
jgi:hypothetical protein